MGIFFSAFMKYGLSVSKKGQQPTVDGNLIQIQKVDISPNVMKIQWECKGNRTRKNNIR